DETVLVLTEGLRPVFLDILLELFQRLAPVELTDVLRGNDLDVLLGDDGVNEQAAGGQRLVISQVFGLEGKQPEAGANEHEDAGAQEQPALALQARLAQQVFEGTVGHCYRLATLRRSVGRLSTFLRNLAHLALRTKMRRAPREPDARDRRAAARARRA